MTAAEAWRDLVRATNQLASRPIERARILELAKRYGDLRAEEASASHRMQRRIEDLQREGGS